MPAAMTARFGERRFREFLFQLRDSRRDSIPAGCLAPSLFDTGVEKTRQRDRAEDRDTVFEVGDAVSIAAGRHQLVRRNVD